MFSWTAADSVDYLIRTTGIPRSKAELDVQRIVTFPGQAVAPEYGLMRLQWLRRSAEKALGLWMNLGSDLVFSDCTIQTRLEAEMNV